MGEKMKIQFSTTKQVHSDFQSTSHLSLLFI